MANKDNLSDKMLRLTLRLSHGRLSASVGDPQSLGSIVYEPYEMNNGISPAANLREAFQRSELLKSGYRRALILNDAPVLMRADIGIAMGALGSDAAIEAADIVLMDDEPMQIAKAIKISRKCIGIVYQNIVFALVVKFACLALVAIGLADMWAAIFADVGVMVLAVLNAIRALRVHNL